MRNSNTVAFARSGAWRPVVRETAAVPLRGTALRRSVAWPPQNSLRSLRSLLSNRLRQVRLRSACCTHAATRPALLGAAHTRPPGHPAPERVCLPWRQPDSQRRAARPRAGPRASCPRPEHDRRCSAKENQLARSGTCPALTRTSARQSFLGTPGTSRSCRPRSPAPKCRRRTG